MKITIASCAYPGARPFIQDWIDGVMANAIGARRLKALVVNDGLVDAASVFAHLSNSLPVKIVDVAPGIPIAEVRRRMIIEAWRDDADGIVFCDADDVLTETAIDVHAATLAGHSISVGDLTPFFSDDGASTEPLFSADLPSVIVAADLARTNICGFSNTAVRRDALETLVKLDWPTVVAVDWWMFATLLEGGFSAAGTQSVVARYRQHGANTVGAVCDTDLKAARRRLAIVAEYHRTRQTAADVFRARAAEALVRDPRLTAILADDKATPGPWYADAARWLEMAELSNETMALVQ